MGSVPYAAALITYPVACWVVTRRSISSTTLATHYPLPLTMSTKEHGASEEVVAIDEIDAKKDAIKGTKRPAEDKNDDIKKLKKSEENGDDDDVEDEEEAEGEEDFDEEGEGEGEGEGDDDDDGEGEEDDDDAEKNRYSACVKPAPVGIFILHLFQPIFFHVSSLLSTTTKTSHQLHFPWCFFFFNIILVFLNILRHNLIAVADLCHCSCVTQVHFPGVFFFFFTKKNIYFCLVCLSYHHHHPPPLIHTSVYVKTCEKKETK